MVMWVLGGCFLIWEGARRGVENNRLRDWTIGWQRLKEEKWKKKKKKKREGWRLANGFPAYWILGLFIYLFIYYKPHFVIGSWAQNVGLTLSKISLCPRFLKPSLKTKARGSTQERIGLAHLSLESECRTIASPLPSKVRLWHMTHTPRCYYILSFTRRECQDRLFLWKPSKCCVAHEEYITRCTFSFVYVSAPIIVRVTN